ncbi:MAG: Globin-coupled histidine kinase [Chloroflexaceae bacterium]|nr:Globin-coupled histidine kinase [Chloroflexaceae bacterium]NJL32640.1 Globin-coupled histidine kinase [Chloroflexaceae bacterium]NJO07126.1 Globin-coupled histidine kinase [Chloroflexaceae bacterium]
MSTPHRRSSWEVKDAAILAELITLMNLSPDEAALLKSLGPTAEPLAPQMTTAFYERLFAHDNTKEYFEGKAMERLHGMIARWFIGLFSGTYDEEYAHQRLYIGHIHVKIGLPVRYPLAMMDVVMQYGDQIAAQSSQPQAALKAFRKVLSLDVAIFNQAYEDNQLKHLADIVGCEALARRLLLGTS